MTKNKKIIKLLLISLILIAFVFFYRSDFFRSYINFNYIKTNREKFANYLNRYSIFVTTIFFISYILFTSISLPFASVLTILAGVIFGFWKGLILASFASSIGATITFLISRFLFRDYFYTKYSDKLNTINRNLKKDGIFYLFSLRMIILFPFWLINILMGLTNISTFQFYWVSQIGMLMGTAIYVYAGTIISQINSTSDIASKKTFVALAIIGLAPLISKKIVNFIRTKKN